MSCDAQNLKLSNCNSNKFPLSLSSGLLKESILHIQAFFQPIMCNVRSQMNLLDYFGSLYFANIPCIT